MNGKILIAGIGNIFQGDDGFGVEVVHKLAGINLPRGVRVLDIGIRSIDLAFALLDTYELIILVDATARGGAPGTLYTIEIDAGDIPRKCDESLIVNSHSFDPVCVLTFAQSMGASLKRVLLIGCEPLVTDHDDTGHLGLSEVVNDAAERAVAVVRELVEDFKQGELSDNKLKKEEVYSNEHS